MFDSITSPRRHTAWFCILASFALSAGVHAQYSWTNFAGTPGGPGNVDGTGAAARFGNPYGVAVDATGTIYVADTGNSTIRKVTAAGVVTTFAGKSNEQGTADGTGTAARFVLPYSIAIDSGGTLYVADTRNHAIRKITSTGVVTTFAGSKGNSGSADGTTGARFNAPHGIAVDGGGNVYVADSENHTIRKITPSGVVSTLAGSASVSGNADGTGGAARFSNPCGLCRDTAGNLYVADTDNHTIRKVTSAGVVTTLAGSAGNPGHVDDTGSAAQFYSPQGIAVDAAGNVYVGSASSGTIRKVTPAGVVTTLAGDPFESGSDDGTGTAARFAGATGLAFDGSGDLLVADHGNNTVRKMTPAAVVTTLAGAAAQYGSADGTGTAARFFFPLGLAADGAGNIYAADMANQTIRKITPDGVVTTLAGSPGLQGDDDGTGSAARFRNPRAVASDAGGTVYVADTGSSTIRKITPGGVVTTFAGQAGVSGSADGTGSAARFNGLYGIAADNSGNVYVADANNQTIRRITSAGVVTTLAGQAGVTGSADGTGSTARFFYPNAVAVDGAGNVYVADRLNNTVRKITPSGVVTTLAGLALRRGSDDGTGENARFEDPSGIAVDTAGNVFVADSGNSTIRKVTPAGVVTTIGGAPGVAGGLDGIGAAAQLCYPYGIAVSPTGLLYVSENNTNRIIKGSALPDIAVEQPAGADLVSAMSTVDFGTVPPGQSASLVFTLKNKGNFDLTGIGVTFDDTDAALFSVTAAPATTVSGPAGSTTFTVRFAPTTYGLKLATLVIASNDPDEDPFYVFLTGAANGPEIEVDDGTSISDGGSRNIGSAVVTQSISRNFVISNTGNMPLTGVGINIDGADASQFTITTPPSASIAAGNVTGFTVRFQPTSAGVKSAALHISSNDADENPFDISLSGTGTVSNNANLSGLVPGAAILSPTFSAATLSYTAAVANPVTSITITPTAIVGSISTITVNGSVVPSGGTSAPINLSVGANTITTICTAQDGTTSKTYTITLTRASPTTGDFDAAFNPGANNSVAALAVQPDGKVLVGGSFTTIAGATRNFLARLNADGTLDAGFAPVVNNLVNCVALLPDGKILIGGAFTSVNSTTRNRLARLNTNGTLDAGFDPNAGNTINSLVPQPDNKVILAGSFTTIGGVTRNRIARVNTDGTLDTGFDPNANGTVHSVTLQADGSVIACGSFTSIASTSRNLMARLTSSGAIDGSFNPNVGGSFVFGTVALTSDKWLVFGDFTTVGGSTRNRVARLNSDGTLDASFDPNANASVRSAVVQADGKILIGGTFTSVAATARNRLARLNADGTLDTAFTPYANSNVLALTLQADGKVLVGGDFTGISGGTRNRIARLDNDAATQTLGVSSLARVEWLRGGTSPEAAAVIFDLSTDGGTNWNTLGNGTRIAGGWELAGMSLPGTGQVRATARVVGAQFNGSQSLLQAITPYSINAPEIVVEQPPGTSLVDGSASIPLGSVVVGSTSSAFTFTIKNTGTANLSALNVTTDGSHAGDFIVSTAGMSTTLAPGGSTTFNVTFTPAAAGARTGALHVASNDADENPFDITLTGTGVAAVPEIAVEQPAGSDLTDGSAIIDFGGLPVGGEVTRVFTVRNVGTANLTGVAVTVLGGNAANFIRVTDPASTVIPGGSTTFSIKFTPDAVATFSATMRIASNDANENPFDIFFIGEGLTPTQAWLQSYFGSTSGTGDAAPTADPNKNGIPNLVEYALGGDPVGAGAGTDILPDASINPTAHCVEFSLTRYLDRTDITLTVQAADSLSGPWTNLARSVNGAPFTVLASGAVVSETGTGATRSVTVCDVYQVTDPAHPRRFMKLEVVGQ